MACALLRYTSRSRSLETFREFLDPSMDGVAGFERGVVQALEQFLKDSPAEDLTNATVKARTLARSALSRLRLGDELDWDAWAKLAVLKTGFALAAGAPGYDPDTDHNGDNTTGAPDLATFKSFFPGAPGPSGLACANTNPVTPCSP